MSKTKWRKWADLSRREKRLLLEAFLELGVSRALLLSVSFKRISRFLGEHHEPDADLSGILKPAPDPPAARVGWAVTTAARFTPWESLCLAQAMTAKRMLRRRQRKNILFLGLTAGDGQKMEAHAWLQCEHGIITGEAEHHRFVIISAFVDR